MMAGIQAKTMMSRDNRTDPGPAPHHHQVCGNLYSVLFVFALLLDGFAMVLVRFC